MRYPVSYTGARVQQQRQEYRRDFVKELGEQFKGSVDTWWFTVIEFVAPSIRHSPRSGRIEDPPLGSVSFSATYSRLPGRRRQRRVSSEVADT